MKIVIKNNPLVKELGYKDFEEITRSKKPYVIKFYNPTCHLCKGLRPIFEQLAEQYKDKFKFGKINSRTEKELFKLFKIDGVPELFIVDGEDLYNIPFPEEGSDPVSGYSKEYIIQHLDGLNEHKQNS